MAIHHSMMCDCLRCGHQWVKRIAGRPVRCPKCKQPNWDTESPGVGRPVGSVKGTGKTPTAPDSKQRVEKAKKKAGK